MGWLCFCRWLTVEDTVAETDPAIMQHSRY